MDYVQKNLVPEKDDILYIIVSQTGTVLSRLLKAVTGASYNHVSMSLDRKLMKMFSFGHINPYNPLWGGFVRESPKAGAFKRFSETEVIILGIRITKEQYQGISALLETMYYYTNYINGWDDWEFVSVYADEGISVSKNRIYCRKVILFEI